MPWTSLRTVPAAGFDGAAEGPIDAAVDDAGEGGAEATAAGDAGPVGDEDGAVDEVAVGAVAEAAGGDEAAADDAADGDATEAPPEQAATTDASNRTPVSRRPTRWVIRRSPVPIRTRCWGSALPDPVLDAAIGNEVPSV